MFEVEPMSINEMLTLESIYNQGKPFPTALRELLLLAGEFIFILDYGMEDTRQQMQEAVRDGLTEYNHSIDRPLFAIEVYNGVENFKFVYLDENVDDPIVHSASLPNFPKNPWLKSTGEKLSEFLAFRIKHAIR